MYDQIVFVSEFGYRVSKEKEDLVITYANGTETRYQLRDIKGVYLAGEGRISKIIMMELIKSNLRERKIIHTTHRIRLFNKFLLKINLTNFWFIIENYRIIILYDTWKFVFHLP